MHTLKRFVVAGWPLTTAQFESARSPSICVFCQRHLFAPRRTFISSSRLHTSKEPKSISADAVVDTLPLHTGSEYREPEFQFEFEQAVEDKKGLKRLEEQRLNQLEKKRILKERAVLNNAQGALLKMMRDVNVDPGLVNYKPAETWTGLKELGGKEPKEKVHSFKNFFKTPKIEGHANITAATYRALVETLAAVAAGQDPLINKKYNANNVPQAINDVKIVLVNGSVQLQYPDAATETAIFKAGISRSRTEVSPKYARIEDYIVEWGSTWLKVSLEEPEFRFAFIRRLSRILGRPIPDFQISTSSTVYDLLKQIARPDPPQTVFESLVKATKTPERTLRQSSDQEVEFIRPKKPQIDLLKLPNVKVSGQRQTLVHKERNLGRWKVIEQELKRRGLPVLN